jgi:hypothetical protein
VGIWNETYQVNTGHFECVCVKMPRQGLGQVINLVRANGQRQGARPGSAAWTAAGQAAQWVLTYPVGANQAGTRL